MKELKKGDKIRRISDSYNDVQTGKIYTFTRYQIDCYGKQSLLHIKESACSYDIARFELVQEHSLDYSIY